MGFCLQLLPDKQGHSEELEPEMGLEPVLGALGTEVERGVACSDACATASSTALLH